MRLGRFFLVMPRVSGRVGGWVRVAALMGSAMGVLQGGAHGFAQSAAPGPYLRSAEAWDADGGGGAKLSSEILSDTRGADLGPYVKQVMQITSASWHGLLDQDAGAAGGGSQTLILISIAADGKVTSMQLDASNHVEALDRLAWGALVREGTFPALPKEFLGTSLEMRFRFSVPAAGVK